MDAADRVAAAAAEFGTFDGRAWFNTAHQGPLPKSAVRATEAAAALQAAPHRIADDELTDVPERLRSLLARLVGGAADEIVLGNSTSHGLQTRSIELWTSCTLLDQRRGLTTLVSGALCT